MTELLKPSKRWLSFSLATFLFISLCVGALIAGYQSGYRAGYNSGQARRYNETQVTETYSTMTLIWPDLPADERATAVNQLKDLIQTTIATEIWGNGTGNEVRDFATNQTLVISAPGSVQREIRDLFRQLGSFHNRGGANHVLPLLQALASQGKSQVSELSINAPKNSQMARAWLERYFGQTVNGVTEKWGAPDYRGSCTDAAFPEWSLDQQIAIWPRGSGVAFIALRYLNDGQLHLVAGWREKS